MAISLNGRWVSSLCLALALGSQSVGVAARDAPSSVGHEQTRVVPLATRLPVSESGLLRFGAVGRLDNRAAVGREGESGFVLVYDSAANSDLLESALHFARSPDGRSIERPRLLDAVPAPLAGSPSFVGDESGEYLYFATASKHRGPVSLWRMRRARGGWGAPEALDAIPGLKQFIAWPRWDRADEGVILSFRDSHSSLRWTLGSPDAGFPAPRQVPNSRGAYVRVVQKTGGGFLASYQRPERDGYMVTWLRHSSDGKRWSKAEPLFWPKPPQRPDVHDAFALPRADHGVDVYYISPANRGTKESPVARFDLYRRAILGPGEQGEPQLLTEPRGIEPLAPTAHRLASGEVLISFADIRARKSGEAGWANEAQLVLFRLPGDAPK